MRKSMICIGVLFLLVGTTSFAAADTWVNQWEIPRDGGQSLGSTWYYTDDGTATGTPLYDINWASKVVDGSGQFPKDDSGEDYYSSWQDNEFGTDDRDDGTLSVGIPDFKWFALLDNQLDGGASGFGGGAPTDSFVVLGFDQPLINRPGTDMSIYFLGGWKGVGMDVFVSSAAEYSDIAGPEDWTPLASLVPTNKPFNWGTSEEGIPAPHMNFEFDEIAGIDSVNFVMFEGNGYWIDAVGAPVPGAVWLLGSGLAGLIGIRRRVRPC